MKNIKKLYFYYSFNRTNLIILGLSIFVMLIIYNMYDFDIYAIDYMYDRNAFHSEYISSSLGVMIPISIVVIMLVLSIDYMTNKKRFDLLFLSRYSKRDLAKIKIVVYLTLSFIYVSILFMLMIIVAEIRFTDFKFDLYYLKLYVGLIIQSFVATMIIMLVMDLTGAGYSAIIALILYFLSIVIGDMNKIIATLIFIYIDISGSILPGGIILSLIIFSIYLFLVIFVAKNEKKCWQYKNKW